MYICIYVYMCVCVYVDMYMELLWIYISIDRYHILYPSLGTNPSPLFLGYINTLYIQSKYSKSSSNLDLSLISPLKIHFLNLW